jgi:acetoin utilization deacetylase AcuC-like enzyme
MNGIEKTDLLQNRNIKLVNPKSATFEEISQIHKEEYIHYIRKICRSGGGVLDAETETKVSRQSFKVALLAAGGALEASDRIMSKEFRNAFVLSRPPGHHAGSNYALGFCIFNNAALAAARLLKRHRLGRILILDIDSHHGNGTQEIFYDKNQVLYISIHEDPSEFPKEGFKEETGREEGLGYNINIPLPFRAGDPSYWKSFNSIVIPIIKQYNPQFFIVSAGFDGYYRDRVGELSLSSTLYLKVFQAILELSNKYCDDRTMSILEGGYQLTYLKHVVPVAIGKMAGVNMKIKNKRPQISLPSEKKAYKIIEKVKNIQSRYWSL